MIDLSDGLGGDATRLAEATRLGVEIDVSSLPIAAGVPEAAGAAGREPVELAVSGGEDYELLAALPPGRLEQARTEVAKEEGVELRRIGRLVEGDAVLIRRPDGSPVEPAGFDQLA
jgi:thiamine-monophosphate kinase